MPGSGKRQSPAKFLDSEIYRQIQLTRYINGQAGAMREFIDELNGKIADLLIRTTTQIDTKAQAAMYRGKIKELVLKYREKAAAYLEKEIKDFIKEQSAWLYERSPVVLKHADRGKIMRDIYFEAFSDTDNITGYLSRLYDRIFQIWKNQISIAYRTSEPVKKIVEFVLGGNGK